VLRLWKFYRREILKLRHYISWNVLHFLVTCMMQARRGEFIICRRDSSGFRYVESAGPCPVLPERSSRKQIRERSPGNRNWRQQQKTTEGERIVGWRNGGSFQWTQFPEGGRDAYIVTKTLRSNLGWPMGVRIPVWTALMFSPLPSHSVSSYSSLSWLRLHCSFKLHVSDRFCRTWISQLAGCF
jgi:hypothetical protein